jgi:hypothetical protein
LKCNGSGRVSFSCLAPWALRLLACRLHRRRALVAWPWCRVQFFFSFAAKKKFHCRLRFCAALANWFSALSCCYRAE